MTVKTTLGVDLGSNSIGWALVGGGLIAAGVRVFPEGVNRDQSGGEVPKNQQRRMARAMRRQIARRARRKRALNELLENAGLLPCDAGQRGALLALDPYEFRRRALDEPLAPFEIGRTLIHLNQRRGFLSNRKSDRSRTSEDSETLAKISALAGEISASGHRTLGEHLAAMKLADPLVRVRGMHTRRDMFESEFEQIWSCQEKNHPKLLTEQLRKQIRDLIFFQRKMYWPKSVIGMCSLEPRERRCPRADRRAQRFRLLQEVNNLKVIPPDSEPRPLSADERAKLLAFLSRSKKRKFGEIRKHLGLLENYGFNLEGGERHKLLGMPTDAILASAKLFGKKWQSLPEEEKNAIVRVLIEADDESQIRGRALAEWGLSEEETERLANVGLPEGYAMFSRTAIERLLPHLEAGLPLMKNLEGQQCALEAAGYLRPDQRVVHERDLLPQPPELTNPIVRQALHEVRKVVNAVVQAYGKPHAIHIELARDVRGSLAERERLTKQMRIRERERAAVSSRITQELGFVPRRRDVDRYLLWQEQGGICIYSGRPIAQTQLFGGDVDIDHILPRSRSLDDSLMNKVVCFRNENTEKGDQTPYEWLAQLSPERYEAVLQRAARLPYEIRNRKRTKFLQKSVVLDDFVHRQLNDTQYISRQVREYVACLGCDVLCTKGQLTAELRHNWGLNEILRDDSLDVKNREDHRHHAIDAVVIALTDRSRLQQLARMRGRVSLAEPWPGFRGEVEFIVNKINVSHRVTRRVSGQLHEETIYGPTSKPHLHRDGARPWATGWIEGEGEFVYRKPLEALTLSMVDDIRDPEIKCLVAARLAEFGITPGSKRAIPKEVWKEPLYLVRKPGRTSRAPSIIRKVRLIRRDLTIQPIRAGACYVKPGNTHHIAIFETVDNHGKKHREMVSVSLLEAVGRVRKKEPINQRTHPSNPDAKFVMSLSRGEMVLAEFGGQQRLLCYRTSASTQGQIYFVDHRDARKSADVKKFVAMANTLKARKVTVDPLGRIRNAND